MSGKRFLRDNILEDMLTEIRDISDKVESTQFPTLLFSHSLKTVNEMYETNKSILSSLEQTIEHLRESGEQGEVLDSIVEAAAHIQIGLVSVHSALKEDIAMLVTVIERLKDTIRIDDEPPGFSG